MPLETAAVQDGSDLMDLLSGVLDSAGSAAHDYFEAANKLRAAGLGDDWNPYHDPLYESGGSTGGAHGTHAHGALIDTSQELHGLAGTVDDWDSALGGRGDAEEQGRT